MPEQKSAHYHRAPTIRQLGEIRSLSLRSGLSIDAEHRTDGLLDISQEFLDGVALRGTPGHGGHFGPEPTRGCLVNVDFNFGGTDAHNFDSFVRQRSASEVR